MIDFPILSLILFIPILGILLMVLIRNTSERTERNLKQTAIWITSLNFLVSLLLIIFFDYENPSFQFEEKYFWINNGISYHLGIDGI